MHRGIEAWIEEHNSNSSDGFDAMLNDIVRIIGRAECGWTLDFFTSDDQECYLSQIEVVLIDICDMLADSNAEADRADQ